MHKFNSAVAWRRHKRNLNTLQISFRPQTQRIAVVKLSNSQFHNYLVLTLRHILLKTVKNCQKREKSSFSIAFTLTNLGFYLVKFNQKDKYVNNLLETNYGFTWYLCGPWTHNGFESHRLFRQEHENATIRKKIPMSIESQRLQILNT